MTVGSENSYAERQWTGIETSFNPDFVAQNISHVAVKYLTEAGVLSTLTRGVHFSVTLGAGGAVTVMPVNLPTAPGTLLISRHTPALQETDFQNLSRYSATVHATLHDRAMLIAAENRRDIEQGLGSFIFAAGVYDWRPYQLAAADPTADHHVATRGWVLQETGIDNLQNYVDQAAASAAEAAGVVVGVQTAVTAAEAARDSAELWAQQNEDTPVETGQYSAKHWAAKAVAAASTVLPYLTQFDDGIFGDADTGAVDDGAFA